MSHGPETAPVPRTGPTARQFQAILSTFPVVCWAVDREGCFILSEGKGLEGIGLRSGEVLGQNLFELYADVPEIIDAVRRALNGKTLQLETTVQGRTFQSHFAPMLDSRGEIQGVQGVAFDVTDRYLAEQSLHQMLMRSSLLLSHLSTIVWEYDTAIQQFLYISENAESLTGFSTDEWMVPHFWQSRIHPDDRDAALEFCRARARMGLDHEFEYRFLKADGSVMWIRDFVNVVELREKGPILRGLMIDITETKSQNTQFTRTAAALRAANDRLARLLDAGALVQSATSEQKVIQIVAGAIHSVGWGGVAVNLFDADWNITHSAYAGLSPERIQALQSRRTSGDRRQAMFGVQRDQYRLSRSYFIPHDDAPAVIMTSSILPGRRPPQPEDTWHPLDLAYLPLYDSSGRIIGRITVDDPIDGQRPNVESIRYLESFADLAAGRVEILRTLAREREALTALQSREQHLKMLARTLPVLVCYVDREERYRYVNESYEVWQQRPIHEIVGKRVCEVLAEPQYARSKPYIDRALSGQIAEWECPLEIADKSRRWARITFKPDIDEHGVVQGYYGLIVDVTASKESELAARESESRFRTLSQLTSDFAYSYSLGPGGRFTLDWASDAFQRITGYSVNEVRANGGWRTIIHPADVALIDNHMKDLAQGQPSRVVARLIRKSGETRWFESVAQSETDPATGAMRRILGATRDITEQKAVEQELRASEARYRAIVEDQTMLVLRCTPDGTISFVNPSMCRYFRVPQEQLIGRRTFEITIPEDRPIIEEHYRRLHSGAHSDTISIRVVGPDAEIRWHEWTCRALRDDRGALVEIQGEGQDVTELRRAQADLEYHAERQRMLLQELDHRVKNALGSLLTLIELSRAQELPVRDFAAAMTNRVRAMATVHDMLSATHWKSVSLSQLLTSLLPTHSPGSASFKGPDVRIPPRQSTALGMVLQEMVSNSLKHGALGTPGGATEIQWRLTTEHAAAPQQSLFIEWRESGGPPIHSQPHAGLGTRLIIGFARSELRGEATLNFNSGGVHHIVHARLDAP